MFAHGFSIHFGQIDPGPEVDVGMAAPKGPGHLVRRQFVEGNGAGARGGAPGRQRRGARPRARLRARYRLHARGVIETTFKDETETDLFGEQAVLCGGVTELVRAGYETLVEAGYDRPRVLRVPPRAEADRGPHVREGHHRHALFDLNTAEYGDLTRGKRIVGEPTREAMKEILGEIQSGDFAREWIAENKAGQENFKRMRQEEKDHQIEREGGSCAR